MVEDGDKFCKHWHQCPAKQKGCLHAKESAVFVCTICLAILGDDKAEALGKGILDERPEKHPSQHTGDSRIFEDINTFPARPPSFPTKATSMDEDEIADNRQQVLRNEIATNNRGKRNDERPGKHHSQHTGDSHIFEDTRTVAKPPAVPRKTSTKNRGKSNAQKSKAANRQSMYNGFEETKGNEYVTKLPRPNKGDASDANLVKELSTLAYYHGEVSREQAEQSLRSHGLSPGVFLVRFKSPGVYVISVCTKSSKLAHRKLEASANSTFKLNSVSMDEQYRCVADVVNCLRRPPQHLKWTTPLTTGVPSADHLMTTRGKRNDNHPSKQPSQHTNDSHIFEYTRTVAKPPAVPKKTTSTKNRGKSNEWKSNAANRQSVCNGFEEDAKQGGPEFEEDEEDDGYIKAFPSQTENSSDANLFKEITAAPEPDRTSKPAKNKKRSKKKQRGCVLGFAPSFAPSSMQPCFDGPCAMSCPVTATRTYKVAVVGRRKSQ